MFGDAMHACYVLRDVIGGNSATFMYVISPLINTVCLECCEYLKLYFGIMYTHRQAAGTSMWPNWILIFLCYTAS
jgi:hypothetical protein